MNPLELVRLPPLMELSGGRREIVIGLIDGPVATGHPGLSREAVRDAGGTAGASCSLAASAACKHGTFVAGMLCGRRGSAAPSICPDCTLLVRPIFAETAQPGADVPQATPDALAAAIMDVVNGGARVLNLSLAMARCSAQGERKVEAALDHAASAGTLVVAAAGNQAAVGSTAITRHPWVISVAGCDARGRPTAESNLGHSIGARGLLAPGTHIVGLGAEGDDVTLSGTSAAAPFVTGTLALLCSRFPRARVAEVKLAIARPDGPRRRSVVPPLLDAWAAHEALASSHGRVQ